MRRQLELRSANEAVDLLDARGARDRRGDALARDEPGERDFGRLRAVRLRDARPGPSRMRKPRSFRYFSTRAAARAALEVGLAAVLAREEARGEAVVDDDAEALRDAQVAQRPLELRALAEVVFRLLDFVARQLPWRRPCRAPRAGRRRWSSTLRSPSPFRRGSAIRRRAASPRSACRRPACG